MRMQLAKMASGKIQRSVIAAIVCASASFAAVHTVTNGSDTTAGSLHDAIVHAAAGDTIMFSVPDQEWVSTPPDTIAKDLVILGKNNANGKDMTVLSIKWVFAIVGGNVRLSHMALIGGLWGNVGRNGGVLFISGAATSVELENVSLSEGQATYGGGIYDSAATVLLNNCSFYSDSACHGGALYNDQGSVTISNCTLRKNGSVGGSFLTGQPSFLDMDVYGGGIFNDGKMTIQNTAMIENGSYVNYTEGIGHIYGSALYNGSHGDVFMSNSSICGTSSLITNKYQGGDDNYSCIYGGGVCNYGMLRMFNSTISRNSSTATCSQSISYYNNIQAEVDGGCVYNNNILIISNCTLSDNTSSTQTSCLFTDNNVGDEACLIKGNCIFSNGSALIVENSTISGNSSMRHFDGSCRRWGDSNSLGSAISCNLGSNFIINTLVVNNSPHNFINANDAGRAISILSGDTFSFPQKKCLARVTTLQVFGVDTPSLADNGGLTQTIAIPSSSIAHGTGVLSGLLSKDTLIAGKTATKYIAVYNEGDGWKFAYNDSLSPSGPQMTSFLNDQRGYVRENPPCIGAYDIGAAPIRVSQRDYYNGSSFRIVSCRGNRIELQVPITGSYSIRVFNVKGQMFENIKSVLSKGLHQIALPHLSTQGRYVAFVEGFKQTNKFNILNF